MTGKEDEILWDLDDEDVKKVYKLVAGICDGNYGCELKLLYMTKRRIMSEMEEERAFSKNGVGGGGKMTEIYISKILDDNVSDIKKHLKKHGIDASSDEILDAAITLTRRLGAGDWTFVCEFREKERRRKEEKK